MKLIELELDGQLERIWAEVIRGTLWFHWRGQTYSQKAEIKNFSRNPSQTGLVSGEVLAPMPGKVTKLLVKEGDPVTRNQNVLVLEAMKMEYTLKSNKDGKIKKIFCQVGEQVVSEKKLLEIE